jgi:hypothetical protein
MTNKVSSLRVLDQLLLRKELTHCHFKLVFLKDGALKGPIELGSEELPNGPTVLLRQADHEEPDVLLKRRRVRCLRGPDDSQLPHE